MRRRRRWRVWAWRRPWRRPWRRSWRQAWRRSWRQEPRPWRTAWRRRWTSRSGSFGCLLRCRRQRYCRMVGIGAARSRGRSIAVAPRRFPGRVQVHAIDVENIAGGPVERTESSHFLGDAADLAGKADTFSGAGPHELEPLRLDAQRFDRPRQQLESPQSLVVLLD